MNIAEYTALNKPFVQNLMHAQGDTDKVSTVINIVKFISDKNSVKASKEYNKFILKIIKMMLADKKPNIREVKIAQSNVKHKIDQLSELFSTLEGYAIDFDDSNAQKVYDNSKKILEKLEYIYDYCDLLIKSHSSIQDTKKKKPVNVEKLISKLYPA